MVSSTEVAKDYIAGGVSGVAMVLTGHPFDTVKVHLQTQNTAVQSQRYRGALHCTAQILQTEGLRGLYKGATSSFIGVAVESSLLFGAYTQVKLALQGGDRSAPELSTIVAAAGVAGAGVSAILCPTELVKCRLQVQAKAKAGGGLSEPRYRGPWDVVVKTVRQDGISGMYRGVKATTIRESIGNVFFFTTYEATRFHLLHYFGVNPDARKLVSQPAKSKPQQETLHGSQVALPVGLRDFLVETVTGVISGGLAGVVFWSAVLPLDVVKTRIQTSQDAHPNTAISTHFQTLYRERGVRGLYAGLGPTLLRAFPANAAAIVTWELAARLLGVGPGATGSHS